MGFLSSEKEMLNYEQKITEWVNSNIERLKSSQPINSGHVDDILELHNLSEKELAENKLFVRSDMPKHLKMLTHSSLLKVSLHLLDIINVSDLPDEQKLLLVIYLNPDKSDSFAHYYTVNDIERQMCNTPPEFIITQYYNELSKEQIDIKELNTKFIAYGYSCFDDEENIFDKMIVIHKVS